MTIDPISKDDKLTMLFYLSTRQTGAIADCLRHLQGYRQHTDNSSEEAGWRAYIKSELGDLYCILDKMCGVLSLNIDEVKMLGLIRDKEKRRNYLLKHPGATWI